MSEKFREMLGFILSQLLIVFANLSSDTSRRYDIIAYLSKYTGDALFESYVLTKNVYRIWCHSLSQNGGHSKLCKNNSDNFFQ